jgi:hypothetical protein
MSASIKEELVVEVERLTETLAYVHRPADPVGHVRILRRKDIFDTAGNTHSVEVGARLLATLSEDDERYIASARHLNPLEWAHWELKALLDRIQLDLLNRQYDHIRVRIPVAMRLAMKCHGLASVGETPIQG